MKHVGKRVIGAVLIAVLVVGILPTCEAQAALSSKTKKVYRQCLANYICELGWSSDWSSLAPDRNGVGFVNASTRFALADIDGDKQEELCLSTMVGMDLQAGCAFKKNGNRVRVIDYYMDKNVLKKEKKLLAGEGINAVSDKALLYEYMYSGSIEGKVYYKKNKGGTLAEYASYDTRYDYNANKEVNTYCVKGKKVNKAKYEKAVKSLGKFIDIQYHACTSENICKYLE